MILFIILSTILFLIRSISKFVQGESENHIVVGLIELLIAIWGIILIVLHLIDT